MEPVSIYSRQGIIFKYTITIFAIAMRISLSNRMNLVLAISILCIAVSMIFTSCLNENSQQHFQSFSTEDEGSPGISHFQLDPIRDLATDDPGISFSKLIRNANKDFIDSMLFRIETKNTLDVIHRYDNSGLDIECGYKIKNVGNFLFVDTGKPANMNKLSD
jgi:hypothetical protein